jgi:hypothetical protein
VKHFGDFCKKCGDELMYIEPSSSMSQCGTDYWTLHGERRWKPLICMACRSKVGKHAKKEQDKQIVKAETAKHAKKLERALNSILQSL